MTTKIIHSITEKIVYLNSFASFFNDSFFSNFQLFFTLNTHKKQFKKILIKISTNIQTFILHSKLSRSLFSNWWQLALSLNGDFWKCFDFSRFDWWKSYFCFRSKRCLWTFPFVSGLLITFITAATAAT